MITCINDLIGTYINKSDKELLSSWLRVVKPLMESSGRDLEWFTNDFCSVELRGGVVIVNSIGGRWISDKRELTLSDFKPTRTEYVKVTDSIFDLKADFEKGEIYTKKAWGEYKSIDSENRLAFYFELENLYRKVEREITWQDEIERLYPVNAINGHVSFKRLVTDEQFIEMCHKVYHLTK